MTTKYTKDHEWVRIEGDVAIVGISTFAADQLGDVVYVELPAIGKQVKQGGDMAVVESAKAASDVYAPVSGEIIAVNDAPVGVADAGSHRDHPPAIAGEAPLLLQHPHLGRGAPADA